MPCENINIKINDDASFIQMLTETAVIPSSAFQYLAAVLWAFRNEIIHYLANKTGGAPADEIIANIEQTAEYKVITTAAEMGVRQNVSPDVALVHDMVNSAKVTALTSYQKNNNSYTDTGLAVVAGLFKTGISYAAARITGSNVNLVRAIPAIVEATRQGYEDDGLLGAVDRGSEALVEEAVPGGHIIMGNYKK